MKRISVLFLATLFLLISTLIFAQQKESLSKSDFGELKRIENLLQPQVIERIAKTSQVFQERISQSHNVNDYYEQAYDIVRNRFKNLTPDEVEIIITKVLYDALQTVDHEIAIIRSELSIQEKARTELNNDIQHLIMLEDEYQSTDPYTRDSVITVFLWERKQIYSKSFDKRYVDLGRLYSDLINNDDEGKNTIQELKEMISALKDKLDEMNEEAIPNSERLQMTMDRRPKFLSALSNMMKKISTTQDSLIQNIK